MSDELIFCGKIVEEWASEKGKLTGKHLSAIKDYVTPVPKIEALAVFETVSSVGTLVQVEELKKSLAKLTPWNPTPKKFTFADTLRDNVQYAFQALALCEHRKNFPAVVWKKIPNHGKQCWFVGYHSTIGSGPKAGVTVGNLTLIWMVSQLRNIMGIDEVQLESYLAADSEPGAASIIDSYKGFFKAPGNYFRVDDVGSKAGNPGNEYIHMSAEKLEFRRLTRIPNRGLIFKKILKSRKKTAQGWIWTTSVDDKKVPEDVPLAFEKKHLDDIKKRIGALGSPPASEPNSEGTQSVQAVEPIKNPKLNARSGRDTGKKPTIRSQENAEAAAPKKKKKKQPVST